MEEQVPEVARELASLYGGESPMVAGVLHVGAVARAADGALRVLKIGEDAPQSATDFFVLNYARARADAILTSAANMRAEPLLSHALAGPFAGLLAIYRRAVLGKEAPATCAILTRSGGLPRAHPVWDDGTRKLVLTSAPLGAAEAWLAERAEVVVLSGLDARRACAFLEERGHGLISVEAGPSTTRALYEHPGVVNELLLSICEAPLDHAQLGGALPDEARLFRGMRLTGELRRREASGPWRFQRWIRAR